MSTSRIVDVAGEKYELDQRGDRTYARLVERDGTPAGGWRYLCPCTRPNHAGPHGRFTIRGL